jgi:excisionase family DNA binding protein
MKQAEGEIYFTPKQAAEHFNLSLSTIKNYIYANKLKTLKTPGGHHRISRSELLATLGETTGVPSCEGAHDLSLGLSLCTSMLNLFKALSITGGSMVMHAKRVSSLSVIVAKAMHMNEDDIKPEFFCQIDLKRAA